MRRALLWMNAARDALHPWAVIAAIPAGFYGGYLWGVAVVEELQNNPHLVTHGIPDGHDVGLMSFFCAAVAGFVAHGVMRAAEVALAVAEYWTVRRQ